MSDPKKLPYDVDALGNIQGIDIPEYNRITAKDDMDVAKAKRKKQQELWDSQNS
jgi:hypothetical protein